MVELAHDMMKIYWKLAMKFLFFKLDQNNDLCLQQTRVAHLMSNLRVHCEGKCISNVGSFNVIPRRIDENLSDNN